LTHAKAAGPEATAEQTVDKLKERLAAVSPNVLSEAEREAAEAMVRDNVRSRIQAANDRSSETWRTIKNRAQWEQFRKQKVAALRASLGDFPQPPKKLNRVVTGTVEGDGYTIENVAFESRPGLWVTANLYRPAPPRDSMPGIIISHSHHRPKEQGELQDMGATWARAGCIVLVPDHLGHGERRQHPFASAEDYDGDFAVSRQDYYFRYDTGMQLHLLGDSLMGWLSWDLMRGVDLLLDQKGIDPERIILLGAVAGGGDPAGVTGAIDSRITCAGPFNFGGPQPETRYPLPEDAETWFNYAGSGSWESTRNLKDSAGEGFLHWVIVGSVAPRYLIYGHEFAWDGERDPVWKRFQRIYGFYDAKDRLAVAHGRGGLKGRPPEASHCTNIGRIHRQMIHPALNRWFDIDATEYDAPHEADQLHVLTDSGVKQIQPKRLVDLLPGLADQRIAAARKAREGLSAEARRGQVRKDWARALGDVEPRGKGQTSTKDALVRTARITGGAGVIPAIVLYPPSSDGGKKPPVVVGVSQGGKGWFLERRRDDIAKLLASGVAVCLPDLRGTGETREGDGRTQYSAATARSSSELMLGSTMVGARLSDLRRVVGFLRKLPDVDAERLAVWGDSPAETNTTETRIRMPHRIDGQPTPSEPLGGLLAMLLPLYEDDVRAVYINGGLCDFRSVLTSQFVLIPHDVVIPGAITAGDLPDLAAALAPLPLTLEGTVDQDNRRQGERETASTYKPALDAYRAAGGKLTISESRTSAADRLLPLLQ
jgi:dienelactone hydrolase